VAKHKNINRVALDIVRERNGKGCIVILLDENSCQVGIVGFEDLAEARECLNLGIKGTYDTEPMEAVRELIVTEKTKLS
jgi:hypothetical protein